MCAEKKYSPNHCLHEKIARISIVLTNNNDTPCLKYGICLFVFFFCRNYTCYEIPTLQSCNAQGHFGNQPRPATGKHARPWRGGPVHGQTGGWTIRQLGDQAFKASTLTPLSLSLSRQEQHTPKQLLLPHKQGRLPPPSLLKSS